MRLLHSSAVDINTAEINHKCLTRWYRTPDMTSKYQTGKSPYCWGCNVEGTMAHIWWDCPKIKNYLSDILQLIKEITKRQILEDPWMCLLHGTESSIKPYKESVIPHLINAAKGLIPRHWQERESLI